MGSGEAALTQGAIAAGVIVGFGYLIAFPFWMIYKLDRIETRLRNIQDDCDEQDDQIKSIERRLEVMDEDIESRRKEIIEAIQLKKNS